MVLNSTFKREFAIINYGKLVLEVMHKLNYAKRNKTVLIKEKHDRTVMHNHGTQQAVKKYAQSEILSTHYNCYILHLRHVL